MLDEGRSVWMAQRQGRTKDGNDVTQQGVLKMVGMAKGEDSEFKKSSFKGEFR